MKHEDFFSILLSIIYFSERSNNVRISANMTYVDYPITENNGYLAMPDLPHNCIFNKVRTGCGGSTIAIRNGENYVIAVPTTELIINKCFPPGEKEWREEEIRPGKSPVLNLFGLYGEFDQLLQARLHEYLYSDVLPKKIICTFDKLARLTKIIKPADFRLLVDEYQNLLKQYAFRQKAINGVLYNFSRFRSFCYMSATPIESDLKPVMLKDVPEYRAAWKDVVTNTIVPVRTTKPYAVVRKIIEQYLSDGCYKSNGCISHEAYFFINSVKVIGGIIKEMNLSDDNCRVICANNEINQAKLPGIQISSSSSKSKMLNFITSKSFEGADFFSEDGLCFVVSNVYDPHTLASIDIDIPQIAGRLRNRQNPFYGTVVHIYNAKQDDHYVSYDELQKETNKQIEIAYSRAAKLNEFTLAEKEQQARDVSFYLYYDNDEHKFQVNDLTIKSMLYEYKLMHYIYSNDVVLQRESRDHAMNCQSVLWVTIPNENFIDQRKNTSFVDIVKEYVGMNFDLGSQRKAVLEHDYPFLNDAVRLIGSKEMVRLRTQKAIKQKMLEIKLGNAPSREELFGILQTQLEIGRKYSTEELHSILLPYNLNRKDLCDFFVVESTTKRVDGKPTYVHVITGVAQPSL